MMVKTRAYKRKEAAFRDLVKTGVAPLLFPGTLVRCANAIASEFTYMQHYRIERMLSPAKPGPALAVVRNNSGEQRVLTSTAWALGMWERV